MPTNKSNHRLLNWIQYGFCCYILILVPVSGVDVDLMDSLETRNRIVDGVPVDNFEHYNYFAQISIFGDNSTHAKRFTCGGSVLNSRYILTSSHCFVMVPPWNQLFQIRVVLGTGHNHNRWQALYHRIHYAEEIVMNPKFKKRPPVTTNDIAVIRLNDTIQFGRNITAVTLANMEDQPQNGSCFVLGFDTVNKQMTTLHSVSQQLWESEKCSGDIRPFFPETEYCGADLGSITKGDSGGPLMCRTIVGNGEFKQFGLVIGKRICHQAEKCPNFYNKVGPFVEWIQKVSAID